MKAILSLIISGALVVSGFGQTRNVLVGTNNIVVQPTNFWSADASNARSGLGLGSAATNPASAFQPSSSTLSNLASSNGGVLTNLAASNIVGTLSISRGGTGATNSSGARSAFGLVWSGLTNSNASTFQDALFGSGTNPVLVDTGGNVVSPANFWQVAPITTTFIESQPITNSSTNVSPSRLLHIHSLGTNVINVTNTIVLPTNSLTLEGDMALVVHKGPTNSLTQVRQAGSTNNIITLNNFNEAVEFTYYNNNWQFLETAALTDPIYFSGTNTAANAAASRANLGLGAAWLTNTNASDFRLAIGVPTAFGTGSDSVIGGGLSNFVGQSFSVVVGGRSNTIPVNDEFLSFIGGGQRNTNSGSYDVLVGGLNNSVGSVAGFLGGGSYNVVSGSANSLVGGSSNFVNGIANFIGGGNNNSIPTQSIEYSFIGGGRGNVINESFSVVAGGVSNAANGLYSFAAGRRAKAINNGAFVFTDSQDSDFSSTNINSFNVRAIGGMSLDLGTNGIIFRTNASASATRTNLGLPLAALTNINNANFRTAIELGQTNNVTFNNVTASGTLTATGFITASSNMAVGGTLAATGVVTTVTNLNVGGAINVTNKAETRTNLGLPWSGLTNTSAEGFRAAIGLDYTNSVLFGNTTVSNGTLYVFKTNVGPFEGLANLIASNNVTVSNETLFRVGTAEVDNKSAQFGFRSTNTNGNGVAVFSVYGYNALMMIGPSDPNAGTNPIQATISSINPNNKVMTLITTNTGAMQMHRPIEWDNTTNAAVTRTNLSLGATNNVVFNTVQAASAGSLTNLSVQIGKPNLGFYNSQGPDKINIVVDGTNRAVISSSGVTAEQFSGSLNIAAGQFITFSGGANIAATRTNLGLPLDALTNTTTAGFQRAIFQTNTAPAAGANLGDAKAWLEISVVTNNVTNSFRIPVFQ